MDTSVDRLQAEAEGRIDAAADSVALDALETEYLGRKGSLTHLLRGLGSLSAEERPAAGARINEVKEGLSGRIAVKRQEMDRAALTARIEAERIDVTLPGRGPKWAGSHPLAMTFDHVQEIFVGLGFEFVESPDVESPVNNFQALNYAPDHPAHDEQMSFYLNDDLMLRTQSTAFQARYLPTLTPPMKLATMGRVYRYEQVDPTHGHTFHQVDGILVDRDVGLADLFGTLDAIMRALYGPSVRTRFRPHFFPFTEPSAELDLSCLAGGGDGCRLCKGEGWLELLGCGMIHPNILRNSGIDPEEYTGFAFGMGLDRIPIMRYGIPDLRLFLENDLRFLEQF